MILQDSAIYHGGGRSSWTFSASFEALQFMRVARQRSNFSISTAEKNNVHFFRSED